MILRLQKHFSEFSSPPFCLPVVERSVACLIASLGEPLSPLCVLAEPVYGG